MQKGFLKNKKLFSIFFLSFLFLFSEYIYAQKNENSFLKNDREKLMFLSAVDAHWIPQVTSDIAQYEVSVFELLDQAEEIQKEFLEKKVYQEFFDKNRSLSWIEVQKKTPFEEISWEFDLKKGKSFLEEVQKTFQDKNVKKEIFWKLFLEKLFAYDDQTQVFFKNSNYKPRYWYIQWSAFLGLSKKETKVFFQGTWEQKRYLLNSKNKLFNWKQFQTKFPVLESLSWDQFLSSLKKLEFLEQEILMTWNHIWFLRQQERQNSDSVGDFLKHFFEIKEKPMRAWIREEGKKFVSKTSITKILKSFFWIFRSFQTQKQGFGTKQKQTLFHTSKKLFLVEVPAWVGIFRGFAGTDCSSCYDPFSPMSAQDHVWFVYDSLPKVLNESFHTMPPRGYVHAVSLIDHNRRPILDVHTINGKGISQDHVEMILDALYQLRKHYHVESIHVAIPKKVKANINFHPIREVFLKKIRSSNLKTWVRHRFLDRQLRSLLGGVYDQMNKNLFSVPIHAQASFPVEVHSLSYQWDLSFLKQEVSLKTRTEWFLMAVLFHRFGYDKDRDRILKVIKLSKKNFFHIESIFWNRKGIFIQEYLQRIRTVFHSFQFVFSEDFFKKYAQVFAFGFLNAKDAYMEPFLERTIFFIKELFRVYWLPMSSGEDHMEAFLKKGRRVFLKILKNTPDFFIEKVSFQKVFFSQLKFAEEAESLSELFRFSQKDTRFSFLDQALVSVFENLVKENLKKEVLKNWLELLSHLKVFPKRIYDLLNQVLDVNNPDLQKEVLRSAKCFQKWTESFKEHVFSFLFSNNLDLKKKAFHAFFVSGSFDMRVLEFFFKMVQSSSADQLSEVPGFLGYVERSFVDIAFLKLFFKKVTSVKKRFLFLKKLASKKYFYEHYLKSNKVSLEELKDFLTPFLKRFKKLSLSGVSVLWSDVTDCEKTLQK